MNDFRLRSARAAARSAGLSDNDDAGQYAQIADAVIAEFARPSETMIDAAYGAIKSENGWAINSRQEFIKAVRAMVRSTFKVGG